MPAFLIEGKRVKLRRPVSTDKKEFVTLIQQSKALHHPWCFPPETEAAFKRYVKSRDQKTNDGFLICHAPTHAVMGVINLNCIVRGWLQSAYLGYYIGAAYAGQGYMQEALPLVVGYAFTELGLHRLEANIQPDNHASLALVKRCGFRKEGFSPRYLKINGIWKDHERWAILADEIHDK
jgi:ribosomal-protein-alanine N-acetyltransferase